MSGIADAGFTDLGSVLDVAYVVAGFGVVAGLGVVAGFGVVVLCVICVMIVSTLSSVVKSNVVRDVGMTSTLDVS